MQHSATTKDTRERKPPTNTLPKPAMGVITALAVVTLLLISAGCASKKWTSKPPIQVVEAKTYRVSIEPLRWSYGWRWSHIDATESAYRSFVLKIDNMSEEDISIVWQKTFYITNGSTSGWFYFADDIKDKEDWLKIDNPKPEDIILRGSQYRKVIRPVKLVGTDKDFLSGEEDKFSGPMPDGENGVYLTLKKGDETLIERVTVTLGKQ